MASTILANAFVFQENLAHGPDDLADVQTIDELRDDSGIIGKSNILRARSSWILPSFVVKLCEAFF